MDGTVTEIREARRQIVEHERAIKKLNDRIDELLGLNNGRRAPKRKMPTEAFVERSFAELKRAAHERSTTQ